MGKFRSETTELWPLRYVKMLCASLPCSNFSTFLPIFFKLYIDIGIGEERYGIASRIISFRNNNVMALDLLPKCIFSQYLKNE